jgi:hypothetical protein
MMIFSQRDGKKERPTMVDMEKKLLEDSSGIYRREIVDKLFKFESEMNVMIHDANEDNALFNRLNVLKTAIQKAKDTIERF